MGPEDSDPRFQLKSGLENMYKVIDIDSNVDGPRHYRSDMCDLVSLLIVVTKKEAGRMRLSSGVCLSGGAAVGGTG